MSTTRNLLGQPLVERLLDSSELILSCDWYNSELFSVGEYTRLPYQSQLARNIRVELNSPLWLVLRQHLVRTLEAEVLKP